jgi:hypothetical protein
VRSLWCWTPDDAFSSCTLLQTETDDLFFLFCFGVLYRAAARQTGVGGGTPRLGARDGRRACQRYYTCATPLRVRYGLRSLLTARIIAAFAPCLRACSSPVHLFVAERCTCRTLRGILLHYMLLLRRGALPLPLPLPSTICSPLYLYIFHATIATAPPHTLPVLARLFRVPTDFVLRPTWACMRCFAVPARILLNINSVVSAARAHAHALIPAAIQAAGLRPTPLFYAAERYSLWISGPVVSVWAR